jgi:hypothetical protein
VVDGFSHGASVARKEALVLNTGAADWTEISRKLQKPTLINQPPRNQGQGR